MRKKVEGIELKLSLPFLLRKDSSCRKCKRLIKKGEMIRTYYREKKGWLDYDNVFCLHCVAVFIARYCFVEVPNPTDEELKEVRKLDKKIMRKLEKIRSKWGVDNLC